MERRVEEEGFRGLSHLGVHPDVYKKKKKKKKRGSDGGLER